MAQSVEEVVVAGDGKVYVAPVGTAFPDFAAEPAAPWAELGFFKTDGLTINVAREATDIYAFQSLDPIRTVITQRPMTVAFALQQSGPDQVALALGGGEWAEIGSTDVYEFTPPEASYVDERAVLIEIEDGDDKYRYLIPRAVNKEGVEFTFRRDEEVAFPVTMSVLAAPAGLDVFNIQTNAAQFEATS